MRRSTILVALFASVGLTGCVHVDPTPDFRQTADMIAERNGAEEVYDPALESLIAEKVDELLAGGLTMEEAVRITLLNNRGFQAMFSEIGASRADVVQSGLLSNPSVGLSVIFPEGGGRSRVSAGFAQQIADLWLIPVRRKMAEAELQSVILGVVHEGVRLAGETRIKYLDVVSAIRTETLAHENVELAAQSWHIAERRHEAGEASLLDANLLRVRVLDLRTERTERARDRAVAELELARVLGLSRDDRKVSVIDPLPSPPATTAIDEEAILQRAFAERLDVQASARVIDAAEQELIRECRSVFPDVMLGLAMERTDRKSLPGRDPLAAIARESISNGQFSIPEFQTPAERDQERRQETDFLIGPSLELTLPIWDQNQAQIARAQSVVQQRRKQHEDLLDTVALEIRTALERARRSDELVRILRDELLPQSEINLEAARTVVESGQQSVLIVIEAQQEVVGVRQRYVATQRDYGVAVIELRTAVGGKLPELELTPGAAPTREPSAAD